MFHADREYSFTSDVWFPRLRPGPPSEAEGARGARPGVRPGTWHTAHGARPRPARPRPGPAPRRRENRRRCGAAPRYPSGAARPPTPSPRARPPFPGGGWGGAPLFGDVRRLRQRGCSHPPRRPGSEERGGAPRLLRTRSTVSRSARRSRPSRPAAFGPRGASLRGGRAGRGGIVACEADAILGRSAALRPPERGPGMRGLPREAPLETEALSIGAVSARVSQARLRRRAETRLPVLCRGPGPGLLPPAVARRPRPEPDPRPSAELPAGFGAAGGRAALNPCRERRGAGGSGSGLPSGPGCLPPPRTHRGAGCELLTCLRRHCPSLGGAYSIAGQGAERWLGLFGFFFFFSWGKLVYALNFLKLLDSVFVSLLFLRSRSKCSTQQKYSYIHSSGSCRSPALLHLTWRQACVNLCETLPGKLRVGAHNISLCCKQNHNPCNLKCGY